MLSTARRHFTKRNFNIKRGNQFHYSLNIIKSFNNVTTSSDYTNPPRLEEKNNVNQKIDRLIDYYKGISVGIRNNRKTSNGRTGVRIDILPRVFTPDISVEKLMNRLIEKNLFKCEAELFKYSFLVLDSICKSPFSMSRDIFNMMEIMSKHNLRLPDDCHVIIAQYCSDKGELNQLIYLIHWLRSQGYRIPNEVFYCTLQTCQRLGDWKTSVNILNLLESSVRRGIAQEAFNISIDTCMACAQPQAAKNVILRSQRASFRRHALAVQNCLQLGE